MSDRATTFRGDRRAFFLRGGAALGAGLASAAGAAPLLADGDAQLGEQFAQLRARLAALEDGEALRQLFLAYLELLELRAYGAVPALFAREARLDLHGESHEGSDSGLVRLFSEGYAAQAAAEMHTAFRPAPAGRHDSLSVEADGLRAQAVFHAAVEVSRPLRGGSVVERMARQQGQCAAARWEEGRFELGFVREAQDWKIARLVYRRLA